MKTKIIPFLLGLCAVIALSSCEKESAKEPAKANLIVKLALNGASSKTTGTTIADSESECTISSVRLFLVSQDDLDTIEEITSDDYTLTAATESDPARIAAHISYTLAGDWYLYVIANCPSSVSIDTSDYDSFVGSYTSTDLSDIWAEDAFMMVNTQNAETEEGVDKAGIPVSLSNLQDDKESPEEVTVTLERVASKVTATVSPFINYGLVGATMGGHDAVYGISKVVIDEVALINCVSNFNLVQQWASDGSLITPSSSASYSDYYYTDLTDLDWVAQGTDLFCLENNSPEYSVAGGTHQDASSDTRMKGRVTGLVVRARIETLSSYQSSAQTDGGEGSGGYEALVLDPDEGVWTKATGSPTSNKAFRTLYKYKGTYFADWQQLFAQHPSLGSTESDAAASTLRSKGVKVFEDGYTYYTLWIETGGDRYVARNVWYNYLITSINAFGDDLPGGSDYSSTDPIDTDSPSISVSLKISDWDIKTEQNYTI